MRPTARRWRKAPASGCRSTGPRRRTTSAPRSGAWASGRAGRRGWRRRSPPTGRRWRKCTRERVPLDWATTQNNLGIALWSLGERESGTARLEEAVAAYRAALEERTRERVPLDWADDAEQPRHRAREPGRAGERDGAAGGGGRGLPGGAGGTHPRAGAARLGHDAEQPRQRARSLGERESGTARLEEAVAAYRAALEEWTRERVPLDWAMTQNNLGTALRDWASGRAARRGWRRRSRPTARRWRNTPMNARRDSMKTRSVISQEH